MASGYPRSFIGAFTGDGTDNRKISVPFRANVIELYDLTSAIAVIQTATMPPDGGLRTASDAPDATVTVLTANGITIEDDGFLVGTSVNTNTNKYHFVARQ